MRILLLIWLIALLGPPTAVRAEPSCPSGNLLAGLTPVEVAGVQHTDVLGDGVLALEGDYWNTHLTALFADTDAAVVYDLGDDVAVRALLLQADGNDAYRIELSDDRATWTVLAEAPVDAGTGMRSRVGQFHGEGRYLRLSAVRGDGQLSAGELQVFCQPPPDLVPEVVFRQGRKRLGLVDALRFNGWGKLLLGLVALGVLLAFGPRRADHDRRQRWLRRGVCGALVVASGLAWTDFGGRSGMHMHDMFHYVMGSRYASEVGYQRLYHCALVAEHQLGGSPGLEARPVRDLARGVSVSAGELLADPGACTDAFDEVCWEAFRRDVQGFREAMGPASWERLFEDHGYNAPPLWSTMGALLAPRGGIDRGALARLAWLDAVLLLVAVALLWWAFGAEAAALAAVIFGVGNPWEFSWFGACFGRTPWLVLLLAAVCLLKKGRSAGGGAALAGSALLRVFPLLAVTPLVMRAGWRLAARRGLDPTVMRVGAGMLVAALVLVPVSAVFSGGMHAYVAFADNILHHEDASSTNKMGLAAVLSWHPARTAEALYDWRLDDPAAPFVQARAAPLAGRAGLRIGLVVAGMVLLALLARRQVRAWELLALGCGTSLLLVELSSYYLVFVVALAPLAAQHRRWTALLLGAVLLDLLGPMVLDMSYEVPWVLGSLWLLVAWFALCGELLRQRPIHAATTSPGSRSGTLDSP